MRFEEELYLSLPMTDDGHCLMVFAKASITIASYALFLPFIVYIVLRVLASKYTVAFTILQLDCIWSKQDILQSGTVLKKLKL